MKFWYFDGQYEENALGTNEISLSIFYLRHVSKIAAHFQTKHKTFVYSLRCPKNENGKIFKNEVAEPYLEPFLIYGAFLRI